MDAQSPAIAALGAALNDPRHRVAAAAVLMDRAWGRPRQVVETPDGIMSLSIAHLLGARAASQQLQATLVIEGSAAVAADADADAASVMAPALE